MVVNGVNILKSCSRRKEEKYLLRSKHTFSPGINYDLAAGHDSRSSRLRST
jgi:hypothetical protein